MAVWQLWRTACLTDRYEKNVRVGKLNPQPQPSPRAVPSPRAQPSVSPRAQPSPHHIPSHSPVPVQPGDVGVHNHMHPHQGTVGMVGGVASMGGAVGGVVGGVVGMGVGGPVNAMSVGGGMGGVVGVGGLGGVVGGVAGGVVVQQDPTQGVGIIGGPGVVGNANANETPLQDQLTKFVEQL
ncbi:AGAP000029-PA-like protein [Anopheles sinensis]|uniref:AGAP000029-PA-like protein n=1 Tax=Anopheles sinensis TaxID=74873 RepID=A0A084VA85_ANOSI|nr:AGAP000029-PA-like protein [Anopheles sinensis]